MAKQRIGILGGTFDPVHQGHLSMALSVLNAGMVDRLLLMPTGDPPYKSCCADREDRWKMLVAACAFDQRLVPSRLEMDRDGPVYTIDTLLALRRQYAQADLYYIIGADALMKLHAWYRFSDILPLCTFLVCPRVHETDPASLAAEKQRLMSLGARIIMIRMEPVDISSTAVRASLADGRMNYQLPVPVREYCTAKGLYGLPGRIDQIDAWMDRLFEALNPHRFAHSLSVALTARRLAKKYAVDPLLAEQAGLLHDCAKCFPLKEMQRIAREHALTDDDSILSSGALLHSLVGAWVARNEYGLSDPDVLDAIAYHNTGHAGMSRLAMCVCLSDSIEPLRDSYPLLERVRLLSELSLERALLLSLEGTSEYVRSSGKYLHPRTRDTIAWLKTLPETRTSARLKIKRKNPGND